MIASCKCVHKGQDELHGKGNRVFNPNTKKAAPGTVSHSCTVCGSSKDLKT